MYIFFKLLELLQSLRQQKKPWLGITAICKLHTFFKIFNTLQEVPLLYQID